MKIDQGNEEHIFKLKHGQTAYFNGKDNTGITEAGKKYIVQEVGVDKTQYDKFLVSLLTRPMKKKLM